MGDLLKRAQEKSTFIKIPIGESTEVMIYRGWKDIVGPYGESFRYAFDVNTPAGLVVKTFDNPSAKLAEQFDVILFGSKVVITRHQKVDDKGTLVENKSYYTVRQIS